jgi:hypothetical protein
MIALMLLGTLLLAGCGEKIKAGQVKIDTASLSKLQEGVNEGHQPWRTDPLEVARADGADCQLLTAFISQLARPLVRVPAGVVGACLGAG